MPLLLHTPTLICIPTIKNNGSKYTNDISENSSKIRTCIYSLDPGKILSKSSIFRLSVCQSVNLSI